MLFYPNSNTPFYVRKLIIGKTAAGENVGLTNSKIWIWFWREIFWIVTIWISLRKTWRKFDFSTLHQDCQQATEARKVLRPPSFSSTFLLLEVKRPDLRTLYPARNLDGKIKRDIFSFRKFWGYNQTWL